MYRREKRKFSKRAFSFSLNYYYLYYANEVNFISKQRATTTTATTAATNKVKEP